MEGPRERASASADTCCTPPPPARDIFAGGRRVYHTVAPGLEHQPSRHMLIRWDRRSSRNERRRAGITLESLVREAKLGGYGELEALCWRDEERGPECAVACVSYLEAHAAAAAAAALRAPPHQLPASLGSLHVDVEYPFACFVYEGDDAGWEEWQTRRSVLCGSVPRSTSSASTPPIPGLLLIADFITPDEEAALLTDIDAREWSPAVSRRTQHYGHGFDYISRTVMGAAATRGEGAGIEGGEEAVKRVGYVHTLASSPAVEAVTARVREFGFIGDGGWDGWAWAGASDGAPDAPARLAGTRYAAAGGPSSIAATLPAAFPSLAAAAPFKPAPPPAPPAPAPPLAAAAPAWPPIDQVTVNDYPRGRGIAAHIDAHHVFEDGVASLSLLGDVVMEFTRPPLLSTLPPEMTAPSPTPEPSDDRFRLVLPRRSLLVLRGEARYAWEHAIPARQTDVIDGQLHLRPPRRLSVTFRRVRHGRDTNPCACDWGYYCFAQSGVSSEPDVLFSPTLRRLREETRAAAAAAAPPAPAPAPAPSPAPRSAPAPTPASKIQVAAAVPATELQPLAASPAAPPPLESKHVHALYDAIASHFSHTRHSPWPRVEAFLKALPPGSVLVDAGCGNGKYLLVNKELASVGADFSSALVDICVRERGLQACVGDAVALPFRNACADVVLSVAVLHHISTEARRVALVSELLRVARPGGGCVFIQAWAQEQGPASRRSFPTQDVYVPWRLARRFVAGTEEEIAAAGGVVDATDPAGAVIFQRYCHVLRRGELEELLAAASGLPVVTSPEAAAAASSPVLFTAPIDASELEGGPRGGATAGAAPRAAPTLPPGSIAVLESWWDRDNWCVVLQKF